MKGVILTDCDIFEPVEWIVGCCDCHSYSVFSLTAIKGLEESESVYNIPTAS